MGELERVKAILYSWLENVFATEKEYTWVRALASVSTVYILIGITYSIQQGILCGAFFGRENLFPSKKQSAVYAIRYGNYPS